MTDCDEQTGPSALNYNCSMHNWSEYHRIHCRTYHCGHSARSASATVPNWPHYHTRTLSHLVSHRGLVWSIDVWTFSAMVFSRCSLRIQYSKTSRRTCSTLRQAPMPRQCAAYRLLTAAPPISIEIVQQLWCPISPRHLYGPHWSMVMVEWLYNRDWNSRNNRCRPNDRIGSRPISSIHWWI